MSTLAETSLSEVERRALDAFVARLRERLGDDLVAVWLYGSRARAEPPRGRESDVDVEVLTRCEVGRAEIRNLARETELALGLDHEDLTLAPSADTAASWAERRAIHAFFQREVERDAVVLHGPHPREVGAKPPPFRPLPGMISPRSAEYMQVAEGRLRVARVTIDMDAMIAVGTAYFAAVNAARAALSERDVFVRERAGMWRAFYEHFVRNADFDAHVHAAAAALAEPEDLGDYAISRYTREDAVAYAEAAEPFVAAVRAMLGD